MLQLIESFRTEQELPDPTETVQVAHLVQSNSEEPGSKWSVVVEIVKCVPGGHERFLNDIVDIGFRNSKATRGLGQRCPVPFDQLAKRLLAAIGRLPGKKFVSVVGIHCEPRRSASTRTRS